MHATVRSPSILSETLKDPLKRQPAVQIYRIVTGRIAKESVIVAITPIELEIMDILNCQPQVSKSG